MWAMAAPRSGAEAGGGLRGKQRPPPPPRFTANSGSCGHAQVLETKIRKSPRIELVSVLNFCQRRCIRTASLSQLDHSVRSRKDEPVAYFTAKRDPKATARKDRAERAHRG